MTRKNQVDVRRFAWNAIVDFGVLRALLAPFFPHETIEYQCEHCGKIFPIPEEDGRRGIRWLLACSWVLALASGLYVLWLIYSWD